MKSDVSFIKSLNTLKQIVGVGYRNRYNCRTIDMPKKFILFYSRYVSTTGIAVFSDVREDYYGLYTSATKHIGDTRVILATPSDNDVTVFLQRTAVTYR